MKVYQRLKALWERGGYTRTIHGLILISFTVVSVVLTLFLSVILYRQFAGRIEKNTIKSTEQLLGRTTENIESSLVSMRRISDAMYYDVIKDKDFAEDSVDSEMNLMYETHKDSLVSIALFTSDGRLLAAAPVSNRKSGRDVRQQSWFQQAMGQVENFHYSRPHVENIFDDGTYRYHWVISLSRMVELNRQGSTDAGVLLVDMNYAGIEQVLSSLNEDTAEVYYYLADQNGELMYHPRYMQILNGISSENNAVVVDYEDGAHEENYQGRQRTVIVDTVGYTGWKLVAVLGDTQSFFGDGSMRYFVVMLVSITLLILLLMNQLISLRISYPLMRLSDSIRKLDTAGMLNPEAAAVLEEGAEEAPRKIPTQEIYIGGTAEVEHLGKTLQTALEQVNILMDDIVVEQEEKRRSEMDALQSQINPHFLYNTLDSIVWMIEGEHNKEAVFMVTQLASFFRISLSRGRSIISLEQELKHAENYMNIQKVRYKNAFGVSFEVDPALKHYLTVKLVIQPILENAIYYGMEGMDDDGEIRIIGEMGKDEDGTEEIFIRVRDNGFGMPPETVARLLSSEEEREKVPKHGSGVGLVNVHKRIQLRFGRRYGLHIESEPDEGTTVTIHLPAIPDTEENRKLLESGDFSSLRRASGSDGDGAAGGDGSRKAAE